MNVCEVKYERDINGKITKKTYLYGKEFMEQEIPAKELECIVDGLISQKKRILENRKKMFMMNKGRVNE